MAFGSELSKTNKKKNIRKQQVRFMYRRKTI